MQIGKPHLNSFAADPKNPRKQPTDSGRGLLEPREGGGELEFIAQAAGCAGSSPGWMVLPSRVGGGN